MKRFERIDGPQFPHYPMLSSSDWHYSYLGSFIAYRENEIPLTCDAYAITKIVDGQCLPGNDFVMIYGSSRYSSNGLSFRELLQRRKQSIWVGFHAVVMDALAGGYVTMQHHVKLCKCQIKTDYFYSGFKGILAHLDDKGQIGSWGWELCGQCRTYRNRATAEKMLIQQGLLPKPAVKDKRSILEDILRAERALNQRAARQAYRIEVPQQAQVVNPIWPLDHGAIAPQPYDPDNE